MARGPRLNANQPLTLTLSGLPHRSTTVSNVGLIVALLVLAAGAWAALAAAPVRRTQAAQLEGRREKLYTDAGGPRAAAQEREDRRQALRRQTAAPRHRARTGAGRARSLTVGRWRGRGCVKPPSPEEPPRSFGGPGLDFTRLAAIDLGRNFGRRKALTHVNFECRAGEIVGLLGPNGAGKSTLLSILATLLRPSTGRVEYGYGHGRPGRRGTARASRDARPRPLPLS